MSSRRLRSSPLASFSRRTNTRMPMTLPETPGGTRSDASWTSSAFLPKMTLSRRSSGVSCCSPFGVTLPTRMSPWRTSVDGITTPASSSASSDSVPTLGMSRVISSGAELRVARLDLELRDMDRRENVLFDEFLGEQDRVLEVVALPRHEADEKVASERELAFRARRAVGQNVAGLDGASRDRRGRLVDAGVLVRARVLAQDVEVDRVLLALRAVGRDRDEVAGRVNDLAGAARDDAGARVARDRLLHPGGDERGLGQQQRHGLALHVRAHEGAVGVVVLEKRHERRRHGDDLHRRDVHVVDAGRIDDREVAARARRNGVDRDAVLVDRRVGLGHDLAALGVGVQVLDLAELSLDDLAVGRLDEAELIDLRVRREGHDEADVRALGRLDRADAAVVRVVHVAHLEAGALAVQAARSERRQAALVRDLGERVDLVHELRQLRRAEELADDADERRRVEQVARRDQRLVLHGHAVADHARHLRESDADLVLEQLADAAHAPVAEMVDVVELDREVAVEQVRNRRAPRLEGAREVGEREAVLLEPLLRDVDVVVAVLLVQVDQRELAERLAVDLLRVVGEVGLVLGEPLVLGSARGHRRGLRRAVDDVRDAAVQRDHVLHRRDDVLEAQRAARERRQREMLVLAAVGTRHHVAASRELPEVVVELDRDLVAADLREVVLAQVLEDQVVEVRLGLSGHDELLAAQLLVDVLLGFLDGS